MKLLAMEFTGEFIHMLHISVKNNQTFVDKIMHVPMPQNCYVKGMLINNDRSISDAVVEKLREEKIRDKKVVLSVSGNDCLIEEFSVLQDKKAKVVNGLVEQELGKRRKLNSNYIYDYIVMGPDPLQQGYVKVKVVLCPKSLIQNYYDVLRKAGLEPYKLDLTSHSMEYLAEKSLLSTSSEISILACSNQEELHFLYCGKNEEPYYRHATISKDDMLEESMFVLSASSKFNLGLDKEENLVETVIENLTKMTRFHSQRHPDMNINGIYVYGDYKDIPTLCDRITNALGIKAKTFNPISSIGNLSMRSAEPLNGSVNVMGTVLSVFDAKEKDFCFFEKLEAAKQEKGSNLFWMPTMIAILLSAALICVTQVFRVQNKVLQEKVEEEQEYLENPDNLELYGTSSNFINEITNRYTYNERALVYMDYFQNVNRFGREEFDILDTMVTEDITIDSIQYYDEVISIHCIGTSQNSPAAFTQSLSQLDAFSNVAYTGFTGYTDYTTGEPLYSFTVTMNLSQEGGK